MASAAKRMKFLLPIKTSKGLVLQTREEVDEDVVAEPSEVDAQEDNARFDSNCDEDTVQLPASKAGGMDWRNDEADEQIKKLSVVEQLALEEAKAKEMKISIANYAQSTVENPQNNVSSLRHLRMMLASPLCRTRPVLADCVVISLCEVFKDILPSYRIRVTTDVEKGQLAKKETKRLRAFEEALLLNYRKYLSLLRAAMRPAGEGTSAKARKGPKWRRAGSRKEADVAYTNRSVAIRCLGQLLGAHPNFNESEELIAWLTPCLNSRAPAESAIAAAAFRQLFTDDRSGEVALRAVKSVCRYAGGLPPGKVHGELLEVLASVRLDLPPPRYEPEEGSFAQMTYKQKQARLSRQQRRQGKRSAPGDRDLAELRLQESSAVRSRRQQRCAELLLHLYVRVLRARPLGARPLAAALAGLNRLALRVNLDLLPDIFTALAALLDWPDLSAENSLLVVNTALSLLTGEGEALTLDPRQFYLHLYSRLDRLVRCHPELASRLAETLRLALAGRRRHLPPARPVSFLRRLLDACAGLMAPSPANEAALLELLACASRLFAVFPRAHHLLEPADDADGGAALPLTPLDGADPDLCPPGAAATCQPGLRRLSVGHPSQAVRQLAARLLRLDFAAAHAATTHQRRQASSAGEPADAEGEVAADPADSAPPGAGADQPRQRPPWKAGGRKGKGKVFKSRPRTSKLPPRRQASGSVGKRRRRP